MLTPNENAARTLGVPPLSLEALGRQILGEEHVAHPVQVQQLMREAVEGALASIDLDGVARSMLPPIRKLFRAGADLDVALFSPRARRLVEVAQTYRAHLRAQDLVDSADVGVYPKPRL